jgi:hypothetical protein
MTRWKLILAALLISSAAFAQKPAPASTPSATETREDLRSILRDHAPQLATVLKLDPTLLTNQAYLATYPDLNTFLTQHPEVAHNPGYYFEGVGGSGSDSGFRAWRDVMGDVAGFTVFLVITGVLIWMIRTIIDQRRWNRLSAIQTEVHSKLLDRFTSNEELLAYLQTPAGKKFLESAPIPLEAGPKPISAPVGRIFWSLQAGLVLIAAGIGFDLVSLRVPNPDSTGLYGVGVIALLIGVALVLSAIVFYGLSKRFGLFQPAVASSE